MDIKLACAVSIIATMAFMAGIVVATDSIHNEEYFEIFFGFVLMICSIVLFVFVFGII